MYILNTTSEKQSFQVFGSWFTLNPGQVKNFAKDGMGEFITQKKRYLGLVELPESFEDPAFKETEEGKEILKLKTLEGRLARINYIKGIIHNEDVSLRMDIEKAGMKNTNPMLFASDHYTQLLKEYAAYKRADEDVQRERMEEIMKLKKEIGRGVNEDKEL